ncbi:MAG: arginyltransferase, partial [Candidatus Aminicenantes bacterium]|nr:arginyltransferase [Candidatus Aminicenantes bacterium]
MSIKGILLHPIKEECPYIEGRIAINENILIKEIDDPDLELLLSLGFRHFGEIFFRPMCGPCHSCVPIRIPVQRFSPSKSVRRLFNRGKNLSIKLEKPSPSPEAFNLYKQHKKRFARNYPESYDVYVKSFFHPPQFKFNRMLAIRDGDRLVALSHLDVTADAMSAIYCYFDEAYSRFSPGKLAVYKEIEIAKEMGIRWLYLGYYVRENRHMAYKVDFRPNQLMVGNNKWIDYIEGDAFASKPRA